MDSKEYSWAWVTADRLLSHGACELVDAHLVPNAAGTSTAEYYDGENDTGDVIMKTRIAASQHCDLHPATPIYCRRGLYIKLTANVRGILIQWRELGSPR